MTGLPAKRKADDESAPNATTTSTKTRGHDPAYLTWSDGADENIRWEICQTNKQIHSKDVAKTKSQVLHPNFLAWSLA